MDVEWVQLDKKNAGLDTVTEWKEVVAKAKKHKRDVYIGKVFETCVEKGSELPVWAISLILFRGRTGLGSNVRNENSVAHCRTLSSE